MSGGGRGHVIDETGSVYGEWTVLERAENVGTKAAWRCRCSCGTERVVPGKRLRNGRSSSCGHVHAGRPAPPGGWGALALRSYKGAHEKVRAKRGRASEHTCAAHGTHAAEEWSFMPGFDPASEFVAKDPKGYACATSSNVHAFQPLCRAAHVERDLLHVYVSPEDRANPKGRPDEDAAAWPEEAA